MPVQRFASFVVPAGTNLKELPSGVVGITIGKLLHWPAPEKGHDTPRNSSGCCDFKCKNRRSSAFNKAASKIGQK